MTYKQGVLGIYSSSLVLLLCLFWFFVGLVWGFLQVHRWTATWEGLQGKVFSKGHRTPVLPCCTRSNSFIESAVESSMTLSFRVLLRPYLVNMIDDVIALWWISAFLPFPEMAGHSNPKVTWLPPLIYTSSEAIQESSVLSFPVSIQNDTLALIASSLSGALC